MYCFSIHTEKSNQQIHRRPPGGGPGSSTGGNQVGLLTGSDSARTQVLLEILLCSVTCSELIYGLARRRRWLGRPVLPDPSHESRAASGSRPRLRRPTMWPPPQGLSRLSVSDSHCESAAGQAPSWPSSEGRGPGAPLAVFGTTRSIGTSSLT